MDMALREAIQKVIEIRGNLAAIDADLQAGRLTPEEADRLRDPFEKAHADILRSAPAAIGQNYQPAFLIGRHLPRPAAPPLQRSPFPTLTGMASPPAAATPAFATSPPPAAPPPPPGTPPFPTLTGFGAAQAQQASSAWGGIFQAFKESAGLLLRASTLMVRGAAAQAGAVMQGISGGSLFRRQREGLEQAGNAARPLAVGGAAAIGGLVAAADPFSTFPTLKGSFEALSIQLGKGFLPLMREVSKALQDAAAWVGNLDIGVKTSIARFAALTVAGAAAIAMFSRLVPVIAGTWRVLGGLGAVVGLSGIGAPLAGLALGVGAVAGAYALLSRNAGEAKNAMQGAAQAGGAPGQMMPAAAFGKQDLTGLPAGIRQRVEAAVGLGKRDEARKILQEHQADAQRKLEDAQAAQIKLAGAGKIQPRAEALMKAQEEAVGRKFLEYAAVTDKDRQDSLKGPRANWMSNKEYYQSLRAGANLAATDPAAAITKQLQAEGFSVQYHEITAMLAERAVRKAGGFGGQRLIFGGPENPMDPARIDWRQKGSPVPIRDIEGMRTGRFEPEVVRPLPTLANLRQSANIADVGSAQKVADLASKILSNLNIAPVGGNRLLENFKGPAASISDPLAYMDRIQIAALNQGDLDAKNMQEQLKNAMDNKQILTQIHSTLERIEKGQVEPWPR